MIIQQFNSGLGNQMFQYVFFRQLRKCHPEVRIRADLTWFELNKVHQGYELEKLFDIHLPAATPLEIAVASGQFPLTVPAGRYINRVMRFFDQKYVDGHHIDEISLKDMEALDGAGNAYLTGYFISEAYYREDLGEIREIYRFPEDGLKSLKDMIHLIRSTEAVSIHVRRGDYLDPVYIEKFNLLDAGYYRTAVERMRELYRKPHFFIFSDDKEFISQAFDWIPADEKTLVAGNSGVDSWKDMYLMSICRGNIIANSTFSTWGALLGEPEGRHVIYPVAYIAGTDSEIKTMEGWERL